MDNKEILSYSITCHKCSGEGKAEDKECPVCGGSGAIIDNKIAEVVKKAFNESRSMTKDTMAEFFGKVAKRVDNMEFKENQDKEKLIVINPMPGSEADKAGEGGYTMNIDGIFQLDKFIWPKITKEIMDHFGEKLSDCYNRGIKDGIAVMEEARKMAEENKKIAKA